MLRLFGGWPTVTLLRLQDGDCIGLGGPGGVSLTFTAADALPPPPSATAAALTYLMNVMVCTNCSIRYPFPSPSPFSPPSPFSFSCLSMYVSGQFAKKRTTFVVATAAPEPCFRNAPCVHLKAGVAAVNCALSRALLWRVLE